MTNLTKTAQKIKRELEYSVMMYNQAKSKKIANYYLGKISAYKDCLNLLDEIKK